MTMANPNTFGIKNWLRLIATVVWIVIIVFWPRITFGVTFITMGSAAIAYNAMIFWNTVICNQKRVEQRIKMQKENSEILTGRDYGMDRGFRMGQGYGMGPWVSGLWWWLLGIRPIKKGGVPPYCVTLIRD